MKIRFAEAKDIDKILALLVQVNMVHHKARPDLFKGPTTKYSKRQLESMLDDLENPIFVAVNDKDIVLGYAFCQTEQAMNDPLRTAVKTLYLDDLCVDELCRGQHVGKALYQQVLDFAKTHGYYNVTLHVWAGNTQAEQFYAAQGMTTQYRCLEQIVG